MSRSSDDMHHITHHATSAHGLSCAAEAHEAHAAHGARDVSAVAEVSAVSSATAHALSAYARTYEDHKQLDFLRERRRYLEERIERACEAAQRYREDVRFMAVSKTVDVATVYNAYQVGYRFFGENRPQELKRKSEALAALVASSHISFDMIGNLQSNKINMVLPHAELIHSISSIDLARKLSKHACAQGLVKHILLEVNTSGELSKSGFSKEELLEYLEEIAQLPGVCIQGLMTMAAAGAPLAARRSFEKLRLLRDECEQRINHRLPVLSCGMSGDFEEAIAEGSTLIRLGRIVFDPAYPLADAVAGSSAAPAPAAPTTAPAAPAQAPAPAPDPRQESGTFLP